MTIQNHPSALTLDLLALDHPASPEVTAHLSTCERCRAQIAASSPVSGRVPTWAAPPPRRRHRWAWPVLAAACAAGLAAISVARGPFSDGEAPLDVTRPKGQPSVAVYVEHQGAVRLWDGRSTVSTGDRLQLKVAAAGFSQLAVGVTEGGGWSTAFTGPVSPSGETALPLSFRVEADTSTLRLGLLLCDPACPVDAVGTAARSAPRDAHRWWTSFVLTRKDEP